MDIFPAVSGLQTSVKKTNRDGSVPGAAKSCSAIKKLFDKEFMSFQFTREFEGLLKYTYQYQCININQLIYLYK